jgi:hypothetical protein
MYYACYNGADSLSSMTVLKICLELRRADFELDILFLLLITK